MITKLTCVLVSVYHTKADDEFIYFWRPKDVGYTKNLQDAGNYHIYPADEHYNTLRIAPLDINSEDYAKLERQEVKGSVRVLNNAFNRNLLGLTIDGRNLKRGR